MFTTKAEILSHRTGPVSLVSTSYILKVFFNHSFNIYFNPFIKFNRFSRLHPNNFQGQIFSIKCNISFDSSKCLSLHQLIQVKCHGQYKQMQDWLSFNHHCIVLLIDYNNYLNTFSHCFIFSHLYQILLVRTVLGFARCMNTKIFKIWVTACT